MPVQGGLGVERMCGLAEVSRAGFYRSFGQRQPDEEEMEVRSSIQQVVLAHRGRYGYRRVSAELRRRGHQVNHKRVLRLMREDNLLAVTPKAFVATTDSNHSLQVHLNLAARMHLTGINQLWVADITYIRLHLCFVYLAVVLDAFSRKVVGWELDRTLAARLPIAALGRALAERKPLPGLVHHSDRGIQYACGDYALVLGRHGIIASMSRAANPYDNAACESFMRTLKREQIDGRLYRDIDHLRADIDQFLDEYYNQQRLHSALGYRTPAEFEQSLETGVASRSATMSFFRHGEIYRWDQKQKQENGERIESGSPPHPIDESPVGYSLAGCSPAEPAAASPTDDQLGKRERI
jgi:putative transposase